MAASTPQSIRASLYIDGKPAENTLRNLGQVIRAQRKELKDLTIGSDEYNRSMAQLQVHEADMRRLNAEIKNSGEAFSWLSDEIKAIGAIAATYLSFDFVTEKFQELLITNAELSDSFADVRKTTGLSENAVRRLYVELGKINTRTSTAELLGLAEVAGKLGVAGERDVLGFVRAADKIKVALGGDLGDAEDAINSLGKLVDLFKVKDEFGLETSLIKAGSAINALGAAGTASEAYIVQFTKRMGGIAPQANFSIESIMGLAATMDELGLGVEASSTAIGQFIVGLGKDIPGFARIAGMSVKDFSSLLQKDGNKALIEVLKNLKTTGQGVEGLAASMGLVGEDGANAVAALGALSNNLDKLTARQKMSAEQFALGTSLQSEFDVKMASLGATVELTTKKLTAFGTNAIVMDYIKMIVFSFSQFIDLLQRNAVMVVNFTKLLLVGVAAWGAYRAALILTTAAIEVNAARLAFARTATIAFAGVQALLTGNLTRAAAAMRLLNITTAANPFGAVLAVVVALATAMALYSKTTSEAQKTQEDFNGIEAEAKKHQIDEIERIKALNALLTDENTSRDKKLQAVKKLREVMPEALKHLSDEEALTAKGTIAIGKYIQALEKKSIAEAAQAQITKLRQRNIEIESSNEGETSIWQDISAAAGAAINSKTYAEFQIRRQVKGLENNQKEKNENARRIASIQERYKSELEGEALASTDLGTTGGGSTGGLSTNTPKAGKSKAQQEKEAALKEFEKLDDQYKKLNLQRLDDQLSANEKEVALEQNKYNALIDAEKEFLKYKGITAEQKTITEDKVKALETEKTTAVNNLRIRQEKEMLDEIKNLRVGLADVHESELAKQSDQINKFYDAQVKKNAGNEKVLEQIKLAREKDLSDAQIREKERLEKEKLEIESRYATLSGDKGDTKLATINKQYDDELLALKEKYSKELQATQAYKDAVDAIEKNRTADKNNLKLDKLKEERDFEIQAAQQAADATFSVIASNAKAKLDTKVSALESERQKELSVKNLTDKQKEQINAKFDAKVREEKLRAWKAEQAASVAQAVINGALAVTKVLAQTGVFAGFAIPAAIATTALQVGTILATPAPKFATGGYSDEDPAGFVSKSTLFANSATGRPFEAGEAGKEWIAPNWMVKSPRYANLINMLEVARKEKRTFAQGGFSGNTPAPADQSGGLDFVRLEAMMQKLISLQQAALARPINFVYTDYKKFESEYEAVKISQMG
jgi:TP901 family phage tail tape measure protein